MVNNREQPYLNLRLHTLYYETAMMEYGIAVQFGVGSILLVDKTNAGVTGSYLELISTDQSYEVLVVSYRKVITVRNVRYSEFRRWKFIRYNVHFVDNFIHRLNQIVPTSSRILKILNVH